LAQPAHKSEPKTLNRRALPIPDSIREPFTYDVLRIHAVAGVEFACDALFAAMICAETFQRRFARLVSFRSGFPFAIWQSDQYSPVIPVT
jgi:hypothetical protein